MPRLRFLMVDDVDLAVSESYPTQPLPAEVYNCTCGDESWPAGLDVPALLTDWQALHIGHMVMHHRIIDVTNQASAQLGMAYDAKSDTFTPAQPPPPNGGRPPVSLNDLAITLDAIKVKLGA